MARVIRGERTILRPATADDERPPAEWEREGGETLVVEADGAAVGWLRMHETGRSGQGDLDVHIRPEARDSGLALDAVDAPVAPASEERGWRRVGAAPQARDTDAIGFWARAGFHPSGLLQTPGGPVVLMIRRRVHPWMTKLRDRKVEHKRRSRAYRISFGLVGVLIILAGLALIPLPGPGWLIVAVGVFMLALEFDRAERLLERILDRLEDVGEQAQRAGPFAKALMALGAIAGVAAVVAAFVLWDVPLLPG